MPALPTDYVLAEADSPKVPLSNSPTATNWVEKHGALGNPKTNWINRTAQHLKGKGMPDGRAIATAINAAKKLCATGDLQFKGIQQANAASRAQACDAVATWQKAKAQAKAARVREAEIAEYDSGVLLREWAERAVPLLNGAVLAAQRGASASEAQAWLAPLGFAVPTDASRARVLSEAAETCRAVLASLPDGNPYVLAEAATMRSKSKVPKGKPSADPDAELAVAPGASGDTVRLLQRRMSDLGHGLKDDGEFGDHTKGAVAKFQEKAGLKPTGKVDPGTVKALRAAEASGATAKEATRAVPPDNIPELGAPNVLRVPTPKPVRAPGARELQADLIGRGYDVGSGGTDGIYGSQTAKAVRSFQREHGLKADGVVGRHTLRMLGLTGKGSTAKKSAKTDKGDGGGEAIQEAWGQPPSSSWPAQQPARPAPRKRGHKPPKRGLPPGHHDTSGSGGGGTFDEAKHPRDQGKFAPKGSGGGGGGESGPQRRARHEAALLAQNPAVARAHAAAAAKSAAAKSAAGGSSGGSAGGHDKGATHAPSADHDKGQNDKGQKGKDQKGNGPKDLKRGEGADKPSSEVKSLQQLLHDAGFDVGSLDGKFGPKTERALKHFQARNGLHPSGATDHKTRMAFRAKPKSPWRSAGGHPLREADLSTKGHAKAAQKNWALPDRSFPIETVADLERAVSAFGRAKDKPKAKRHIIKSARALGATSKLPDAWELTEAIAAPTISPAYYDKRHPNDPWAVTVRTPGGAFTVRFREQVEAESYRTQ